MKLKAYTKWKEAPTTQRACGICQDSFLLVLLPQMEACHINQPYNIYDMKG